MTTALEGGEGSASRPGRNLPPGKTRYPLYKGLGGPQGRSGQVRKISLPTRIRSPDRPARSQSLYRLRYPALCRRYTVCIIYYHRMCICCFWYHIYLLLYSIWLAQWTNLISGLSLTEHITNGDQWSDICNDINDFDMNFMFSPQS